MVAQHVEAITKAYETSYKKCQETADVALKETGQ